MSSPERTARERFVKAQQKMWEALCEYHSFGYKITHKEWMRQAIEAHARRVMEAEHRTGAHDRTPCLEACYELEVAALLKEVFGE